MILVPLTGHFTLKILHNILLMSAYGSGLCSVYIFWDLFTHFIVRQMKIENPIALNSNSTPLLKKPHNS